LNIFSSPLVFLVVLLLYFTGFSVFRSTFANIEYV